MSKIAEKTTETPALPIISDSNKLALAQNAFAALTSAKTAEDIRNVFTNKEYGFAILGHKNLGRMLLGRTPEQALGIEKSN